MKKITICFTRSTVKFPIFSWLIQKLWGTKYSHVALIVYPNAIGDEFMYHASSRGLHFNSSTVFYRTNEIVYKKTIEVDKETYKKVIAQAMKNAGEDYGLMQAIGIGVAYLLERWGIGKINPFRDGRKKWACSEWVAVALLKIYPELAINLETVSPQDIYKIIQNLD